MKLIPAAKWYVFLFIFLFLFALSGNLSPATTNIPGERMAQVEPLLSVVEQNFLGPSRMKLSQIDIRNARHLENLAILLGLALRSQITYVQADQTKIPCFIELQGQTMLFLADLTVAGGHTQNKEKLWKNYALESMNGNFNDYLRNFFKIDAEKITVPSLLSFPMADPSPIDISLVGKRDRSAAFELLKKAGGGLQAEKDGVTLLGREYGDRSPVKSQVNAVAPDVTGVWKLFIPQSYLHHRFQGSGDSVTVIRVFQSGDTYIGKVTSAPPGFKVFVGRDIFKMKIQEAARSADQATYFVGQASRVQVEILADGELHMKGYPQWVNAQMTYNPKNQSLFVSSFNSGNQAGSTTFYDRHGKKTNCISIGLNY